MAACFKAQLTAVTSLHSSRRSSFRYVV